MTTANILSQLGSPGVSTGFKNRLINSAMVIDQRNNGASVTPAGSAVTYIVDRFATYQTQSSKFTIQQNAGSITPPVGFTKYLGVTSLSAFSVGAGDIFELFQPIEGYNIADLAWGTANAKTITLSFWAYSSLTGTFGGSLVNVGTRSYPFSYSIPVANTWTQISITIVGDTTGTWATDNTQGMVVRFGLGCGSNWTASANSWQAGNYVQPTGTVSVVGTSGATFYLTGVQLEIGTTATNFEVRDYGRELIMCQRYFQRITPGTGRPWVSSPTQNSTLYFPIFPPIALRTTPSVTDSSPSVVTSPPTGNNYGIYQSGYQSVGGTLGYQVWSPYSFNVTVGGIGGVSAGQGVTMDTGPNYYINISAEL